MNNTLVLFPFLKNGKVFRHPEKVLEESVSLAQALSLHVIRSDLIPLREIQVATFLGKGIIESYRAFIQENKIDLIILSCHLSALQQRNLEKIWQIKVLDKTALILEIFGQRAKTKEGILQVKLANLTYARSRLVRSWTHLERQRGGSGFLGGPGETQIELDRRLIDENIVKIKKELEEVKKTRGLHRKARKRVPFPIIALVGYTNAGKSTLFNYLTRANVFAKDMLFATLDPTIRQIRLPSGQIAVLSDTVGFISDLPPELVMAFRATLEEVLEADVIIHVRDYHHPDSEAQKKDVEKILNDLGLKKKAENDLLEALNKIDLFDYPEQQMIIRQKKNKPKEYPVSAKTGEGINNLLKAVEDRLNKDRKDVWLKIPVLDGKTLAQIYQKGEILSRRDHIKTITLKARIRPEDETLFSHYLLAAKEKK